MAQEGDCWVYDDAMVYHKAKVFEHATIRENAQISGRAEVYGLAHIYGNANISDKAEIYDCARIYDDASVSGMTKIYGNAKICGNARIYGKMHLYGHIKVDGNATLSDKAEVNEKHSVYVFSSHNETFTLYKDIKGNFRINGENTDKYPHIIEFVKMHSGFKINEMIRQVFEEAKGCDCGIIPRNFEIKSENDLEIPSFVTNEEDLSRFYYRFIANDYSVTLLKCNVDGREGAFYLIIDYKKTGNLKKHLSFIAKEHNKEFFTFSKSTGEYYLVDKGVEIELDKPMFNDKGELNQEIDQLPFMVKSIVENGNRFDEINVCKKLNNYSPLMARGYIKKWYGIKDDELS